MLLAFTEPHTGARPPPSAFAIRPQCLKQFGNRISFAMTIEVQFVAQEEGGDLVRYSRYFLRGKRAVILPKLLKRCERHGEPVGDKGKPFRFKRVYDGLEPDDGFKVPVDRL